MRNIKILEMLNDNKIEELKTELRDEIYTDSLKEIPTAKKRYIAMKKYFSYTNETRERYYKSHAKLLLMALIIHALQMPRHLR